MQVLHKLGVVLLAALVLVILAVVVIKLNNNDNEQNDANNSSALRSSRLSHENYPNGSNTSSSFSSITIGGINSPTIGVEDPMGPADTTKTLTPFGGGSSSPSSPSAEDEARFERDHPYNDPEVTAQMAWDNWQRRFKRSYYVNDTKESHRRRQIFEENRNYIIDFNNAPNRNYKLKLNHFADLTTEEINQYWVGKRREKLSMYSNQYKPPPPVDKKIAKLSGIQEEVNWSDFGYVSFDIQQGRCPRGEIYAVLEALQSANKIKMKSYVQLSKQQLLDCLKTKEMRDNNLSACDTSLEMVDVLFYLQQVGALSTKDYPVAYSPSSQHHQLTNNQPQECKLTNGGKSPPSSSSGARFTKLLFYGMVHPADIVEALQHTGPMPVMLDASQRTFHFYSEGIYDDPTCSNQHYNHHALLVGYEPEHQAWILQNSFGKNWGQQGQIRIKRTNNNLCGLEEGAVHLDL